MRKRRFSEEQIIGILKEQQPGLSAAGLCRKHGISDATFYKWRSKYGGLEVLDARRLKALEEENARLKKLLAEAMIDVSRLREMLGKKLLTPGSRRGRKLGDRGAWLLAAVRLRPGGHSAEDLPLQAEAGR